jgi:pyruvate dehydrogenase E2 component (dihydrolipoamide acetyltransferase)
MIASVSVPDVGEGVTSGRVVAIHLKVGDMIAVDDTVVELETDKAVVEIPSSAKGKVVEVPVREGQELKVGDVIARVETEDAASDPQEPFPEPAPSSQEMTAPVAEPAGKAPVERDTSLQPVPASPSIRRLARELGVNIHEVRGSGPSGRISEADIKSYVKQRKGAPAAGPGAAAYGGEPDLPDFTRWGEIETVDFAAVRRITAQSTTTSWKTIPHVTQFDKADITGLDDFISKNAKRVSKGGGKLTVTAIVAKVCAKALKKFPRFNASIDLKHERLIYKKYIHIGIAVDTPRGLLMPVIANADTLSITELAAAIMDLAERSRNKKIKSAELDGGTFSISNQGGIGGAAFTPIVLWPQAAILGISRASIEPKYVDGEFRPRKILPLSLSYDHRIIDGADAVRFLRWICESLENAFTMDLE